MIPDASGTRSRPCTLQETVNDNSTVTINPVTVVSSGSAMSNADANDDHLDNEWNETGISVEGRKDHTKMSRPSKCTSTAFVITHL